MKRDELIAYGFLESLDIGPVVPEPEGASRFPDFSVNGLATGVEVRRLNQNYITPRGKTSGFEDAEYGLLQPLSELLDGFGLSIDGESWRVSVTFRRPIAWKHVRQATEAVLTSFKRQSVRADCALSIAEGFVLELTRATKDHGTFFFLWLVEDTDVGGNVLALVEKNLRLCVEAKATKVIPPIQQKYAEWWLVLVNRVDLSMKVEDYVGFREKLDPPLAHPFNRIYLIDPKDYRRWVRI